MSYLTKLFNSAKEIPFDKHSKFVLMSDCHRGDGSGADNFSKNRNSFLVALEHYRRKGFTYIELGDGDELWANRKITEIVAEHAEVFTIMAQLYKEKRMYMLYGNHDIVKKNMHWSGRNMLQYKNKHFLKTFDLFPGIRAEEAFVLKNKDTGQKIFLIHGHQVDYLNNELWRFSRLLVRYLWRPLELIGVQNPLNVPKNDDKVHLIERKLIEWVKEHQQMLIAGHIHKCAFPATYEPPYFNDGCCVYPDYITAIEVENCEISLVKWGVQTKQDGTLFIGRDVLKKPIPIAAWHVS